MISLISLALIASIYVFVVRGWLFVAKIFHNEQ